MTYLMSSTFRIIVAIIAVLTASYTLGASVAPKEERTPQVVYVEQFAGLAVEEMYRSGVPASITLAQGLLESRYGLSELAVKGNNHFGIKCHNNWRGGRMYHDDDRRGECFRKYSSPEESFRDHSDFLRYRDRYRFLFDLETTDYKGWAYGLKKAGYATDPAYPSKLIRLIEDYSLYKYDRYPADFEKGSKSAKETRASKKEARALKKEAKVSKKEAVRNKVIPEAPSKIEEVVKLDKAPDGVFVFSLTRQMYSLNGVPFIYSSKGETYQDIAKSFKLFPKEILKFNDLNPNTDLNEELAPGTLVYVQPKRKEAARGLEKHVMEDGDTLWGISQRFGVKLSSIYKMNGLSSGYIPKEGDIIKIRK